MKCLTYPVAIVPVLAVSLCGCTNPSGSSTYAFINPSYDAPPVDASSLKLTAPTAAFQDADPIEPLAVPRYPSAALSAGIPRVTITVRITVGKDGHVESIARSLADMSFPTRFDREFHAAIEGALRQWRFRPAELARLDVGSDGRPIITESEETDTSFDVQFTFSPSGAVTSNRLNN